MNIKSYFNIRKDLEDEKATIERIRNGVLFQGANLWILIFAIFIASLGLNVNSTAVIIGAMLISPLMGPIIGMGLAVGVNDLELLKKSVRSYAIATIISVLTATVYFLLSPYQEAQSELLARTSPTLYDVLIAFMGGAAGILALCIKDKGNVLPGVAIATALMPPLCTAGYGLAMGKLPYFAGAFFLYFINTVFIALATFLGVRFMKFKRKAFVNAEQEKIVHRTIVAIVLVTMLPAAYMTWNILNRSYFNTQVSLFIRDHLNWEGSQVVANNIGNDSTLRVVVVGKKVTDREIERAQSILTAYSALSGYKLKIIQGSESDSILALANRNLHGPSENGDAQKLLEKESEMRQTLQNELATYKHYEEMSKEIAPELRIMYPSITSIVLSKSLEASTDTLQPKSYVTAIISSRRPIAAKDRALLKSWLSERTHTDSLRLITTQ